MKKQRKNNRNKKKYNIKIKKDQKKKQSNHDWNWKNLLGLRSMQEKLEKARSLISCSNCCSIHEPVSPLLQFSLSFTIARAAKPQK